MPYLCTIHRIILEELTTPCPACERLKAMTAKGNYQTTPLGIAEALNDVAEFHKTFGHPILERPAIPSPDRQVLRSALLRDEYLREFDPAWAKCAQHYKLKEINGYGAEFGEVDCLADMADVICDLIYYLLGTALEYGLPLEEVWQEVQRSNMAKLWSKEERDSFRSNDPLTFQTWRFERRAVDTDQGKCFVAYDETGKVRKPPSWKEPDVKAIIRRAMAKQLTNKELAS